MIVLEFVSLIQSLLDACDIFFVDIEVTILSLEFPELRISHAPIGYCVESELSGFSK